METRRTPGSSRAIALATALCLVVGTTAGPVLAQAQPSAADQTLAEALFQEARKLMDQGRFGDACPKLAESQRLDPGGGTQLLLAQCYEKLGKTATAWTIFNEALATSRKINRADRERLAKERIAALEAKLSKLTIRVPADVASLEGFLLTHNGSVISRAAFGLALPVDPGPHEVVVAATGRKAWRRTVEVAGEGDNKVVEVPMLEKEAVAPPPPSAAPAASSVAPPPSQKAPPPSSDPQTDASPGSRRTMAYVAGGVGAVGLVLGTVFALRAKSKYNDSRDLCPADPCRDPAAVDLNQSARSAGNVATVAFGVGLVGVGVGTYLFLTSAPEKSGSVALGVGAPGAGTGASLFGRF